MTRLTFSMNVIPSHPIERNETQAEAPKASSEVGKAAVDRQLTGMELKATLDAFDPGKPLSEQPTTERSLEFLLDKLLAKGIQAGGKMEEFRANPDLLKTYKSKEDEGNEDLAVELLKKAIAGNKAWWEAFTKAAEGRHKTYVETVQAIDKNEEPGWMETYGPYGKYLLLGVGAYSAYQLLFGKKSDTWGQALTRTVKNSALTVIGLGGFLNAEKIDDWALNWGLDMNWKTLAAFFSGGGFAVFDLAKKFPGFSETVELLNVNPHTLYNLKDKKIGDLKSQANALHKAGESILGSGLASISSVLGVDLAKQVGVDLRDKKTIAEEELILDFINLNQGRVSGDLDQLTVGAFLAQLETQGLFKPGVAKKLSETNDSPDDPGLKLPDMPASSEEEKAWFPNTVEAIWSEEFSPEAVFAGVIADGASLVGLEGGLYLIKEDRATLLSTPAVVTESFRDLAEMYSGEKSLSQGSFQILERQTEWVFNGGGKAVVEGTAIYRTIQGLKTTWNPVKLAGIATRGAWEGGKHSMRLLFTLSGEVPGRIALAGARQLSVDNLRALSYSAAEVMRMTAEGKQAVQHARAVWHANEFRRLSDLLNVMADGSVSIKGAKGALYRMFRDPEKLKQAMSYHAKEFFKTSEAFQKSKLGFTKQISEAAQFGPEEIVKQMVNVKEKMSRFFQLHPDYRMPLQPFTKILEVGKVVGGKLYEGAELALNKIGLGEYIGKIKAMDLPEGRLKELVAALTKSPEKIAAFKTAIGTKYELLKASLKLNGAKALPAAMVLHTFYSYRGAGEAEKADEAVHLAWNLGFLGADLKLAAGTSARYGKNPLVFLGLFGAQVLGNGYYDSNWKPHLDKYYPNRNEWLTKGWTGDVASLVSFEALLNAARYADSLDDTFGWDTSDETIYATTDPLEYLDRGGKALTPGTISQAWWSWHSPATENWKSPIQDIKFYDLAKLQKMAKQAADQKRAELDSLSPDDVIRRQVLEEEIKVIDGMADLGEPEKGIPPQWMLQKDLELAQEQEEVIQPIHDAFEAYVSAMIPKDGPAAFDKIIERIQKTGEFHIEGPQEQALWEVIFEKGFNMNGEEMRFPSFIGILVGFSKRKLQLQKLLEPFDRKRQEVMSKLVA